MPEPEEVLIWNPETGIMDLGADWEELSVSEIPGIRAAWRSQQERLKGTNLVSDFTERLGREWAIETGIIENLYDIDRGVTQTLIDRGFRAELLTHRSINRPREFVLGLLRDQKRALDGVFDFVKSARSLSTGCPACPSAPDASRDRCSEVIPLPVGTVISGFFFNASPTLARTMAARMNASSNSSRREMSESAAVPHGIPRRVLLPSAGLSRKCHTRRAGTSTWSISDGCPPHPRGATLPP